MKKRFWGNVPYLWITGVLGLGVLVMLFFLVDAIRFNGKSKTADGQVLSVHRQGYSDASADDNTARDSVVEYVFTVNGKPYRGKDSVSIRTDAQAVAVYYSPDNPDRNRLSQANGGIPAVLMVAMIVLAACSLTKWVSFRRLERTDKARWALSSGEGVRVILPKRMAR